MHRQKKPSLTNPMPFSFPTDRVTRPPWITPTKPSVNSWPIIPCSGYVLASDPDPCHWGKHLQTEIRSQRGQPTVKNIETEQVSITSQNHGFASEKEALEERGHRYRIQPERPNGFRDANERLAGFSVQYHPEASPDPTMPIIFSKPSMTWFRRPRKKLLIKLAPSQRTPAIEKQKCDGKTRS